MIKTFTIDARTILQLGRESIKDHTTALLELVKNSYDADAKIVEIEIYKRETKNYIRIADDGIGMTETEIDENWLRIGYSEKKANRTTARNRRKTGEKGIGRLSADRLGGILNLKTITSDKIPFGMTINWEMFNQDGKKLSEIPIDVLENPTIKLPPDGTGNTGTELIINNLRDNWTEANIENLCAELSILKPPFREVKDFEIFIKNDITTNFNGRIEPPTLLNPELEIEIDYDGESLDLIYSLKDKFHPGKSIEKIINWQELMHKVIDPYDYHKSDKLLCGPVNIRLLLYPRTKSLIDGTIFSLSELREFINKNVGVKIYRDNISVKPYGYVNELGGDWLGLADRHSRNPAGVDRLEYRVVGNQLVGAVFIGRDTNPTLIDSAGREGLVENQAQYDLRALVLGALSLLESRRYQLFQDIKKKNNIKESPIETVEKFLEKITSIKEDLRLLRTNSRKAPIPIAKTIEKMEDFVQQSEKISKAFEDKLSHSRVLAGLATIGISSAVFGHETQGAITEFKVAATNARDYLQLDPPNLNEALPELEKAIKYGDQVSSWGAFILTRVQKDKRKKEKRNIKALLERILLDLQPMLNPVHIRLEKRIDEIECNAFPMDIESILLNLITNAYYACMQNNKNRTISVILEKKDWDGKKGFSLIVANSGPPIDKDFEEWIWEPLNTLKKDRTGRETGTGLGLTVVKSIIEDLKGTKKVETDPELGGAKFIVWLPMN